MLITNASSVEFTSDFTVSAWINYMGGNQGPRVISTSGYEIGTENGFPRKFWFNNTLADGSAPAAFSSKMFGSGLWHHLLGRRQGDVLAVFVNGVKEGESVAADAPSYARGFTSEIGGNSGSGADIFAGSIDDIRFYN